jgi:hypothetical protein
MVFDETEKDGDRDGKSGKGGGDLSSVSEARDRGREEVR